MRLTCLGERNGVVQAGEPACHLLEICDTRLLLECPLDLSALSYFLPTLVRRPEMVSSLNKKATGYGLKHGNTKSSSIPRKNHEPEHAFEHGSSSHTKRQKLQCQSDADGVGSNRLHGLMRDWNAVNGSSPYKELGGQISIDAEPWYKTADLGLVDVALLDAVIISNPVGMLGLPFLTRHPEFSAKIFATDATTKFGQLLIEELLSSHNEYVQLYGHSSTRKAPPWLELKHIAKLPSNIKDALYGVHGTTRANWHPIYSVEDVRGCLAKISRLRYGEEASIDGILVLKPSSSGFGIGASNWVVTSPGSRLTYIATSMSIISSAMGLNLSALKGNQILLLSDLQASEMSNANPLVTFQKTIGADVDDPRASEKGSLRIHAHRFWPRRSSIGSTSQPSCDIISKQSPSTISPSISAETLQVTAMGSTKGTQQLQSVTSGRFLHMECSEKDIKANVSTLAKEVNSAVSAGGCVLIPTSPSGLIFELIEEISLQIRSAGMGHIPMFYVSSAAEELLAYSNIIPEWLAPSRQEKLYAGEALFGVAELLKEKHLIPLPSLQTPEFSRLWQEPCVVFAAHWSLRMGPAVQLLHRWGQNMYNMLVLLEPSLDIQLALSPFQPLAIQVLRSAVISGLRPKEVPWAIENLQPMVTLVPEFLKWILSSNAEVRNSTSMHFYSSGQSVFLQDFPNEIQVEMSPELAASLKPKQLKTGKLTVAKLTADLCTKDGNWSLEMPRSSRLFLGSSQKYGCCWGVVNVLSLVTALKDCGLSDLSVTKIVNDQPINLGNSPIEEILNFDKVVIEIRSPSPCSLTIMSKATHISSDDPALRHLVTDAVNRSLERF